MQYPNKEQRRALSMLQHIGWKWNFETLKKDVISCWNIDEAVLEDETVGYSLKKGRRIATILSSGAVIMEEVTANGVPIEA